MEVAKRRYNYVMLVYDYCQKALSENQVLLLIL